MSLCTDCPASTPHPFWLRCFACAYDRMRAIMSPVPIPARSVPRERRYRLGERVIVTTNGKEYLGKIARMKGHELVIDLDDGDRYYTRGASPASEVRPA